jgi:hypothetical protein
LDQINNEKLEVIKSSISDMNTKNIEVLKSIDIEKPLSIFIPLTKVDEEKRLVYGLAATETPDKSDEIFDYESSKPYVKSWTEFFQKATEGKSAGNIRVQHTPTRLAGHAEDVIMNDDSKTIEIAAKVTDDVEWNHVLQGDFTGFSIGGKYIKKWKDPDNSKYKRYTADISEVSLVDSPCNQECVFEIQKADGSLVKHVFKSQIAESLEKIAQRKDTNPKEGKEKYGDVKFADEKNHKYPIDTEAHIRAAWNYINIPKNSSKYSSSDVSSIKSKIVAAWKSKIDKDGPPAAKKINNGGTMNKIDPVEMKKWAGQEISDSNTAIQALSYIVSLLLSEENEGGTDPEDTDQITSLKSVVENLKNFIASEILESDEDDVINRVAEFKEDAMKKLLDKCNLQKAGAKHSKETVDKIQKIHDHIVELGAKCDKEANKTIEFKDLKKESIPENIKEVNKEEVVIVSDDNLIKITDLSKQKDELTKTLTDLKKTLVDKEEEISKLKSMPEPAKGIAKSIDKLADVKDSVNEEDEIKIDMNDKDSIEKASKLLMSKALSNPIKLRNNQSLVDALDKTNK